MKITKKISFGALLLVLVITCTSSAWAVPATDLGYADEFVYEHEFTEEGDEVHTDSCGCSEEDWLAENNVWVYFEDSEFDCNEAQINFASSVGCTHSNLHMGSCSGNHRQISCTIECNRPQTCNDCGYTAHTWWPESTSHTWGSWEYQGATQLGSSVYYNYKRTCSISSNHTETKREYGYEAYGYDPGKSAS